MGPGASGGAAFHPARRGVRRSRSSAWAPSGGLPITIDGQSPVVAEVPDSEELIEAAGRTGYVQWIFRPVRGGVWAEVAEDLTLAARRLPQPAVPVPEPAHPPRASRAAWCTSSAATTGW